MQSIKCCTEQSIKFCTKQSIKFCTEQNIKAIQSILLSLNSVRYRVRYWVIYKNECCTLYTVQWRMVNTVLCTVNNGKNCTAYSLKRCVQYPLAEMSLLNLQGLFCSLVSPSIMTNVERMHVPYSSRVPHVLHLMDSWLCSSCIYLHTTQS